MYTQIEVRKVQQRLLEMAKAIKEILEKHNIPYFITYGTLLGAIRHKGFIPWDDDFDFYLLDEHYKEAMDVLRCELPHDMFLENEDSEPLFFHGWAHVKDLNSVANCDLYPQDGQYAHHGISVDLYHTKRIPANTERLYRAEENLAYQKRKLRHGFISDADYKQQESKLLQIIAEEQVNAKNPSDEEIYAFKIFYDDRLFVDELFPLKQYQFEDTTFFGPNKPEALLSRCYGDFMKLPPEEKRKPHYSDVIFK